jgi:Carboxypeptidase regulatory-like domain
MSNSIQSRFFRDRCGYSRSTFHFPALLIVFTLFVLFQKTLLAQAPEGTIRGVVRDVTGAVVTKTTLRVSQPQFGGRRVVGTNVNGQYYITNLEPGDYEIEASATGFNTEVQHVTLRVGDELTVNFQLHPGSVNERVLVSGQTSGINTSDLAVNGSVGQVQVQNLPLNGRNFLELARLEPGVNVVSVANPGTFANTIRVFP